MTHTCHALGCEKAVPPKMLMCAPHWRLVPVRLQREVWAKYRPGQEIDKRPNAEYLDVQKRAVAAVAQVESCATCGHRHGRYQPECVEVTCACDCSAELDRRAMERAEKKAR